MAVCPKGSLHIEGLYGNVKHLFERMLFDLTIQSAFLLAQVDSKDLTLQEIANLRHIMDDDVAIGSSQSSGKG